MALGTCIPKVVPRVFVPTLVCVARRTPGGVARSSSLSWEILNTCVLRKRKSATGTQDSGYRMAWHLGGRSGFRSCSMCDLGLRHDSESWFPCR